MLFGCQPYQGVLLRLSQASHNIFSNNTRVFLMNFSWQGCMCKAMREAGAAGLQTSLLHPAKLAACQMPGQHCCPMLISPLTRIQTGFLL
jgi:hypothetical protein